MQPQLQQIVLDLQRILRLHPRLPCMLLLLLLLGGTPGCPGRGAARLLLPCWGCAASKVCMVQVDRHVLLQLLVYLWWNHHHLLLCGVVRQSLHPGSSTAQAEGTAR
jgi:hypothetical protein